MRESDPGVRMAVGGGLYDGAALSLGGAMSQRTTPVSAPGETVQTYYSNGLTRILQAFLPPTKRL